jgi:hypothetical protein
MNGKGRLQLSVPRDLYAKIGSQEKTAVLIRNGLLSLRATRLERESADLNEKIRASKKLVAELPYETERLERLLGEAIGDRKTLESLLERGTR